MERSDEQERALLYSQGHIWNQMYNFVTSMALKCAVQLGIPDTIKKHGGPMALPDLVSALQVNPSKALGVFRLMRVLVHSGFFTTQKVPEICEEEGYWLTPAAQLLLKDEPLNLTQYLLLALDQEMFNPFHHLGEWFHNDDPTPFHSAYGMGIYDFCSTKSRINHLFNEAMASDSRLIASIVVKKCKGIFEGMNSLVDVAGGTGTMAKAIADNFPNLKVTVLNLPHVVAEVKGVDTENLKFVGSDMFEVIPSADAILLKWILHNWSDEDGVKILKRCKDALGSKGGKVIIIDMVLDINNKGDIDDNSDNSSDYTKVKLCFDIVMLAKIAGKERTEKEWANLFVDAGFSDYKITPILSSRSLIEWILHNWSDEDGVKILKRCKDALGSKGGKVIIIDMVLDISNKGDIDDNRDNSSDYTKVKLCFDIVMLAKLPGKERTEKEWANLFVDAGFSDFKIIPILSSRSLIEVYP